MEALDGLENAPEEHYYPFEPRDYAFSAERADYLAKFADLRTGAGNKYLAYGRMLPPLEFERGRISMDWFHYNHGKETKEYNDSGTLEVDAIVHSAWRFKEESIGLFFANVSEESRRVKAALEPGRYGLTGSSFRYVLFTEGSDGASIALAPEAGGTFELEIPARSVILLEIH